MSSALQPARLILASASPRRQMLLRDAGFSFVVDPADIDESDVPSDLSPAELALLLSFRKAQRVAQLHPRDVVLAADTIVALNGQILGKPNDADHARQMLSLLSGSTHFVITGVTAILEETGWRQSLCVTSTVQMRNLSHSEIDAYVAGGEWQGKAGGYGIQDRDPFVVRQAGSLTNIVGLPMEETLVLLQRAGVVPGRADGEKLMLAMIDPLMTIRVVTGVLGAMIIVIGWLYTRPSKSARQLANIEREQINQRRLRLRRWGGVAMMVLGIFFAAGFNAVDYREHPQAFGWIWLGVGLMVLVTLWFAVLDFWLTRRLSRGARK